MSLAGGLGANKDFDKAAIANDDIHARERRPGRREQILRDSVSGAAARIVRAALAPFPAGKIVDQGTAAFVFSAYGLGGLVGGIPTGYIADRVGRRRFLIVALLLAGIAGAAAFVVPPSLTPSLIANFFLGMLLNGLCSNCYAGIQDEVAEDDIPVATGLLIQAIPGIG